jgi:hypothetical protein
VTAAPRLSDQIRRQLDRALRIGDLVAQISGMGNAVAGNLGVVPTLAATIALDAVMMNSRFVSITNTASISAVSVTTNVGANPGGRLVIQFNQYSGGSGALTFSTGFRSTGTVTPSSAKAILVNFQSDGTTYNEVGRSVGSV